MSSRSPLLERRARRHRAGGRRDRGASDALGLALLAPVMIGLALVIVFVGRSVDNRAALHGAAESAAQAAALESDPAAARAAAERVGAAMLGHGHSCEMPSIEVDLARFRPGGTVAVTVSCSVSTSGVELVSPPRVRGRVTAFATIDPYRSLDDGS